MSAMVKSGHTGSYRRLGTGTSLVNKQRTITLTISELLTLSADSMATRIYALIV